MASPHCSSRQLRYFTYHPTYYTYVVGDDVVIDSIHEQIKSLKIDNKFTNSVQCRLTPHLFKKEKRTAKRKGVDIQLTVDVLSYVYNNVVDAVFILTGDGDYEPLFREVRRCGKQLFLAAFSEGLNPRLPKLADEFYLLDHYFFTS